MHTRKLRLGPISEMPVKYDFYFLSFEGEKYPQTF